MVQHFTILWSRLKRKYESEEMEKNIFIFDENKCVGCHSCVVACINENGFQSPERWRNVVNSNPVHHPDLPLFHLSLACNHCDDAPCMSNCPAQAFYFDNNTGAIEHDPDSCIGCKYCTWACPYDAPKFNSASGIIEKCTFCSHRIEEDLKPACANLCPTGALDFERVEFTLDESLESSPVPVKIGSSLKTIRRYNKNGPYIDKEILNLPKNLPASRPFKSKISPGKEWPLLSFSLLSTFMVVLYMAKETFENSSFLQWLIPGMGILAAAFSLIHLGKKEWAWKSILNIEKSWLSREIFFFSFFFFTLIIDFFVYDIPDLIVIVNGLLMLISIDMLYILATWRWKIKIHSAQVIFIAATLWLLLNGYEELFIITTIIRAGFYSFHKSVNWNSPGKSKLLILSRLSLPVIYMIVLYYTLTDWPVIVLLVMTDIIDRIEFYKDLKVPDIEEEFYSSQVSFS